MHSYILSYIYISIYRPQLALRNKIWRYGDQLRINYDNNCKAFNVNISENIHI